ncbi:MAG: hydrogenase expression/formation protein HypE [Planctomycetota bacterium]
MTGESVSPSAFIELAHGAGGRASRRLTDELFVPAFRNPVLERLADAAELPFGNGRLALTTDAFVVRPLRFPGGSIGTLAVHGTINDLAVAGADPIALTAAFLLEAGLARTVLEHEVQAMAAAALAVGVAIVGGDTKVVEHGKADGLYIVTTGVGAVDPRVQLGADRVCAGDRILLTGPIGDHGITILLARGDLDLQVDLRSDTRSVLPFTRALRAALPAALRWMRDPTRGGVGTALNELAEAADLAIELDERAIPIRDGVRGACELLGLDPLHIANEGQCLAVVAEDAAEAALAAWRAVPGGERAAIIGRVGDGGGRVVYSRSELGGKRVVDMLVGDPLPRIC